LYDCILTFPLELSTVWESKLNATTILFVINRYFFLVNSIMNTVTSTGFINTGNLKVSKYTYSKMYMLMIPCGLSLLLRCK